MTELFVAELNIDEEFDDFSLEVPYGICPNYDSENIATMDTPSHGICKTKNGTWSGECPYFVKVHKKWIDNALLFKVECMGKSK